MLACSALILFGQETAQKKYGDALYSISKSKTYSGDGEFQKIELESREDLYQIIVDMIGENKVTAKKQNQVETTKHEKLKLEFVTWEGFSGCKNVIRKYVSISSITGKGYSEKSVKLFLFHKDEFDKISKQFNKGRYSKMFSQFLYNIDFDTYPSVIISKV